MVDKNTYTFLERKIYIYYNIPGILTDFGSKWETALKLFFEQMHKCKILGHNLCFDLLAIYRLFIEKPLNVAPPTLSHLCTNPRMWDTFCLAKYHKNGLNEKLDLGSVVSKYLGVDLKKELDFKSLIEKDESGYRSINWVKIQTDIGLDNVLKYMIEDVLYIPELVDKLTSVIPHETLDCYMKSEGRFIPLLVYMSMHRFDLDQNKVLHLLEKIGSQYSSEYFEFCKKYITPHIQEDWVPLKYRKKYRDLQYELLLLKNLDKYGVGDTAVTKMIFEFLNECNIQLQSTTLVRKLFSCFGINASCLNKTEMGKLKQLYVKCNKPEDSLRLNLIVDLEKIKALIQEQRELKKYTLNTIQTYWKPFQSTTGRSTSVNLPLQNMTRTLRSLITPKQGNVFIVADLTTIELRILAEYSIDVTMLSEFSRPDADLHLKTAQGLFKKEDLNKDSPERKIGKILNFSIAYGSTIHGLYERFKYIFGIDDTEKQVGLYIQNWYKTYPRVRTWRNEVYRHCRAHGWVSSIYGRRLFLKKDNLKTDDPTKYNPEKNTACNHPIQSSCTDIMYDIYAGLLAENLIDRLRLIVHDEIVLEVPEGVVENYTPKVSKLMAEACKRIFKTINPASPQQSLPDSTLVDLKITKSWGD